GRGRAEKYSERPVHIIVNRGNPRTRNEAAARAEIVNAYRGGSCRLSLRSDRPCGHNAAQRVASLRTQLVCRHCERSEAIHPRRGKKEWIASSLALPCTNASRLLQAMTRSRPSFQAFVPNHPVVSPPVPSKHLIPRHFPQPFHIAGKRSNVVEIAPRCRDHHTRQFQRGFEM